MGFITTTNKNGNYPLLPAVDIQVSVSVFFDSWFRNRSLMLDGTQGNTHKGAGGHKQKKGYNIQNPTDQ